MTPESPNDKEILQSVLDPDVATIDTQLERLPSVMDRYAELLGLAIEEEGNAEAELERSEADTYMSTKQLSPITPSGKPTEAEMKIRLCLNNNVLAAKKRVAKAKGNVARLKAVLETLRTQAFLVRERSQRELTQKKTGI